MASNSSQNKNAQEPKTTLSSDAPAKPTVRADGGDWQTMKNLWPYIWPQDRKDLQMRVAVAMVFLVLGKIVTVLTCLLYTSPSPRDQRGSRMPSSA